MVAIQWLHWSFEIFCLRMRLSSFVCPGFVASHFRLAHVTKCLLGILFKEELMDFYFSYLLLESDFQGRPAMDPTDNNSWVSGRTEQEALANAAKSFGIKDLSTISLKQVSNVFAAT